MPVKPRPAPSELLSRMTKREREGVRELERRLKAAQREVAEKIRAAAERRRIATDAGARDRVYGEIESVYERLAEGIDSWTRDLVGDVAREWHREAIDEVPRNRRNADLLRFDRERVERYWSIVRPGNDKHLAAVFTDSLTASSKRMLRSAFVDTFRQSAVSGWTANEIQKRLQQRWDALAGDLAGDRFVDASGRVWPNARYLQMLIRTTQQRVSTESFMDTMAQGGFQLARISDDGDPCPVCRAWAGVVVDIVSSGKTKYPNLKDAFDSGWKHPNCGCRLEYMDETVDADELKRQAAQPTPDRPRTLQDAETRRAYIEKVQAYSDTIRIAEKRAAGMTAKEAETDLKRDKLKTALRVSFLDRHAKAIDQIPPAVLGLIPMDKLPRFELAKKGDLDADQTASNRKSALGGVIKVARDATGSDATVEVGRHIRLTFAKTALDEVGTVLDANGRATVFSHKIVYHWERKDKNGMVKTIEDIDGRLAHLPDIVEGVRKPAYVLMVREKRLYLRTWSDGDKTKYGCVIAAPDGNVETVLFASKQRKWRKWTATGGKIAGGGGTRSD